jgi:hypothetical protein
MKIQYLEIVTKEVDAVCAAYAAAHDVQFGEPDSGLGDRGGELHCRVEGNRSRRRSQWRVLHRGRLAATTAGRLAGLGALFLQARRCDRKQPGAPGAARLAGTAAGASGSRVGTTAPGKGT